MTTAFKMVTEEGTRDNLFDFNAYKEQRDVELAPALRRLQGKTPTDSVETKAEEGAEVIKDISNIDLLLSATLSSELTHRRRMGVLIVLGLNYGLRISDLVRLRWKDLYECDFFSIGNPDAWTFRDHIIICEEKTDKNRVLYTNSVVRKTLEWFKDQESARRDGGLDINEYLFVSSSSNKTMVENTAIGAVKKVVQCPIYEDMARKDMRSLVKELGLNVKFTPHSLRKTFGYNICLLTGENCAFNSRSTSVVQKIFMHSDIRTTMRYVGMDRTEIEGLYMALNLGKDMVDRYCTNN